MTERWCVVLSMKDTISELIRETEGRGVKLIAVTKTVPVEVINEAISYGIKAIGENLCSGAAGEIRQT